MTVSRLFISPAERRLRSGWRLLLQLLLLLVIGLIVGLVVLSFTAVILPDDAQELLLASDTAAERGGATMLIGEIANLITITTTIYLARRVFDRRSFVSLGLARSGALRELLIGLAVAALMMAAIYGAEWGLGWLRFDGMIWQTESLTAVASQTLIWLGVFGIVGWQEELLSRGYWLRNLLDGTNVPVAVLISSLAFALMHIGNPNVSWTAIVGLLAAGVWFAYAALTTRQLWLPIGAHIGWNFFEATVFGFPVSGLDTFGLVRQTPTGPAIWTGGAFGPEAGLIVLPALALGALAVWGYSRRRLAPRI